MTSKERIRKILDFQTPDRIGIYDRFLDTTEEYWKTEGLPKNVSLEDYFDLDFEIFHIDDLLLNDSLNCQDSQRFTAFSFSEPFQRLCDSFGRENILRRLAAYPKKLKAKLVEETDRILYLLKRIIQKDRKYDGAWVWGDLAYKRRSFFSPSCYKELLFPLHKKIFQFLNSNNIYVLFHSDGNISDLIPYLLDAGVRAFHPLEENSDMDIDKLLRAYSDDMVFIGNMDIEKMIGNNDNFKRVGEKIDIFKKRSSYIYHADYPIMPNISFEDYSLMIKAVKEYGAY